MQTLVNKFGPLAGRTLLALIFVVTGTAFIGNFNGVAGYMASKGVPIPQVLLAVSVVIKLSSAAMIILGWRARIGALLLLLWMIPVTFVFHNFWAVPADQAQLQMTLFLKNLAMMGGMLMIMAYGSGPMSIEKR